MKFKSLEALRGLAALYVVFHHGFPSGLSVGGIDVSLFFKFGQEAVIIFFLMSGFVVHYSWSKSQYNFSTYFMKRFLRIYLPLMFVFPLSFLLSSLNSGSIVFEWEMLILNILMLQDISSLKPGVIVSPVWGNSPLWSLSYEWWFYMAYYPLVRYISEPKYRNLLVFILSAICAFVYWFYPVAIVRYLMYFSIWWSGVYLAQVYIENKSYDLKILMNSIFFMLFIMIILAIGAINKQSGISLGIHPWLEVRHFFATFVFLLLLWGVSKFHRYIQFYWFEKLAFLAPFSYVLYVSHEFFVKKNQWFSIYFNDKFFVFFLGLSGAIIFSWVVEVYICSPIQRRLDLYFLNRISK